MICNQLVKCVESLQKDKKAEKTKRAKNKDKKASSLSYKCPCSDEGRIKKCVQFSDKRERPSCSEKGKTYTLTIGQHMFHTTCLRLDGGVVDSLEFRRCDYLFSLADAEKRTILTELKGTNVGDAMNNWKNPCGSKHLRDSFTRKKSMGGSPARHLFQISTQRNELICRNSFFVVGAI